MSGMSLYGVQGPEVREATVHRPPGSDGARAGRAVRGTDHLWLAGVCVLFGVVSLIFVPPWLPLGWDETVYVSRFAPYGPETPFSAPRTWGVPVLAAPVAAFSDSVTLLRCYFTALAALALYLGYRPWLRLPYPARVPGGAPPVALAAGLYGSVWFALFYAGSAMPNHYVAAGCVAAVGCFLRLLATRTGGTREAVLCAAGLCAALAVPTLMRPNDMFWPALVLLLAALFPRLGRASWSTSVRRRAAAVAALGTGLALGLLPWVVEALVRFGGVAERLRVASDVQGGMRPAFSLPAHAAALDGPLLCRPCHAEVGWVSMLWWLLIPPLVVLGVRAARARGHTGVFGFAGLPVLAAVAVAAPYLFLMDYAAPRFLLPAYALLALVAAAGVCAVLGGASRARRRWLVPLAVALLLAHLGYQLNQLALYTQVQDEGRGDWERVHRVLAAHGVRPPCVLDGNSALVPVAHAAGCRPRVHPDQDGAARASAVATGDTVVLGGTPDALALRGRSLPAWASAAGWRVYPVPGAADPRWRVALPPRPVAGADE